MNFEQREQQFVFQTYKRFPLSLVRGKGVFVWDENNKQYLDFLGGIAVNALGHCHPAIVAAVQQQIQQLGHTSNLYYTGPMIDLAEKLAALSGLDKVFYCNSGAEANETAIKLARKFHPDKWEIITCQQSFHGRTLAAITATGQPKYHKGFEPLMPGFRHVPYNDIKALEAAISDITAAVMVEPIQGEGGVVIPDEDYLERVRKLCDEKKILLVLDEIQTGNGRTGKFFCYEHNAIRPDIVTLAKALAGGLPIGVCIASDEAASAFKFGDHAATFGGNPVCCAAALAFLDTLESENLIDNCTRLGNYFLNQLHQRFDSVASVQQIRGKGLMIGIEFTQNIAGDVCNKCMENGLLSASAGANVLRFLPPYIITEAQIDQACDIIDSALRAFN